MGTRAVVRFEGKPMLATHWDGNPTSLGADLVALKNKSAENVVKVASEHNIDQIEARFAPKKPIITPTKILDPNHKAGEDFKYVKGEKVTYFPRSQAEMTALQTKFEMGDGTADRQGTKDLKFADVVSMDTYGDFAEWEYNIKGDKVFARRMKGEWRSDIAGEYTPLPTKAKAEELENKVRDAEHRKFLADELKETKANPKHGVRQIMTEVETGGHSEGDEWIVDSYKDKLIPEDKEMVNHYLQVPKVRKLIGSGWHYESLRHKLASYGIKTNAMKGNMPKMKSMAKRMR